MATRDECDECGRKVPAVLPAVSDLDIYCGACGALFSLDEIEALFAGFNAKNGNAARDVRRKLFDDLLRRARVSVGAAQG